MKKLFSLLALPSLITALFITLANSAQAQTFAFDSATNYTTGWNNGENQGFGFQPWILLNTNVGGGFSGFYIGNPGGQGGITQPPGNAFGEFANSGTSNAATAFRAFSNSLTASQVFKLQWANHGIGFGTTNIGGFSLRHGNFTDDVNDGTRFDFFFEGGVSDSFVILDGSGGVTTGIPYEHGPFSFEFSIQPGDTYQFVVLDATGTTVIAEFTGPLATGIGNNPANPGDTIDSVSCFALSTGGDQMFNNFAVVGTSVIPPVITAIEPTNGAIFIDPTTTNMSFQVSSGFSTVSTNNISLSLNGVAQAGLTFTGNSTNWTVNVPASALQADLVYNATIVAIDANGNHATNNLSFNTWSTNLFFIEAEDYNFSAGGFVVPTNPNELGGLLSTNLVDYFKPNPNDGGTNAYRPGDLVNVDAPPTSADVDHDGFVANGYVDYNLSFVENGEWENYTRAFTNVTYAVYARMAGFGNNPTMEIEIDAGATATTTNQPRAALGTCVCPANTGGPQIYTFVPLTDFFSSNVLVKLNGTNTLRCTDIGGNQVYNFNYLVLVPSTNTATLRPFISAGFPFPNATGVGVDTPISFTIANHSTTVTPASIQLSLNSNSLSPLVLSNNSAGTLVSYTPTSLLAPGSTNTLTAIFKDSASVSITNTWTFVAENPPVVPAAFAQPVGSNTNRGFGIFIAKGDDNATGSDFPPSVARAEQQLAGTLTNSTTLQPYTNEALNNGLYTETNVINYDINLLDTAPLFTNLAAFPDLPAGTTNNIAMEAEMYVQLAAGVYTFGVTSDDGFKLTAGSTPSDTNLVLGSFNAGRPSGETTFDFIVQTNGLYPARLLYFKSQLGGDDLELYSVNRTNGTRILINDTNNANSIKAFQAAIIIPAVPVQILNPSHSGNTTQFSFLTQAGHTHFVEYKNTLSATSWTPLSTIPGTGSMTTVTDSTASGAMRFYRVRTQ